MTDITALGEILIDELVLEDRTVSSVGGAPANLVRTASKTGLSCALIGAVGDDENGKACVSSLIDSGVSPFCPVKKAPTTVAVVSLDGRGDRSFAFHRGADSMLEAGDVSENQISGSRMLHIGTLSLSAEPVRTATVTALEYARKHGVPVSCDVNYRDALWPSETAAREAAVSVLPYVTLLKVSQEEAELIAGCPDPADAAEKLAGLGPEAVAVTLGENGAVVHASGKQLRIAAKPVKAVDTTGAGDSFWGAFLACLLRSGWRGGPIGTALAERCSAAGTEAAAECVQKHGAI